MKIQRKYESWNKRGRYKKQNYHRYTSNYIEELAVKKIDEKCCDYVENKDFGNEYENCIITKSCLHLKVKSINDKKIYTRQRRHLFGLKLLLINKKNVLIDMDDYIAELLDEGQYKIVPFSNYYYEIAYGNQESYYISFNNKGLFIVDEFYDDVELKNVKIHSDALKKTKSSYSDTYYGTYNLFQDKKSKLDLDLIIYSSEAEIDGLFEVIDNIHLSEYKAESIYTNYSENEIKAKSLLLYEIKSGDKLDKLISQMGKRSYFIFKYLKLLYDIPIYYFGFYRKMKDPLAYKFNSEKDENCREINSSDTSDKNEEEKGEKRHYNSNSSSKNKDIKNIQKCEDNGISNKNTTLESNKNLIKDNSLNVINVEKQGLQGLKSKINIKESYSKTLEKLPVKITIFKLTETIFGEELKYDKEELNLIRTLRDDVKIVKQDIKTMKTQITNIENKIKNTDNKIENIENKIQNMENKFDKYFKAIFKKLKIEDKDLEK